VISCNCQYCVERRTLSPARRVLKRRNPDDLERLEQITEARRIYKETGSIKETALRVGRYPLLIKKWVSDLEYVDPRIVEARKLYQQGVSLNEIIRRLHTGARQIKEWIADLIPEVDPRIAEARKLYQQGVSLNEMKRRLRTGRLSIKKWIADLIPEKGVDPRIQEARKLYRQGVSIIEISRRLRAHNVTVKKWIVDVEQDVDPRIQEARELYQEGLNLRKISSHLRAGTINVKKWVADLISEKSEKKRARKQEAQELYQLGMPQPQIISNLKTSSPMLARWIEGIHPTRRRSTRLTDLRRRNPDDLEELEKIVKARRLYQQGVSRRQITKKLHIDLRKLNKWLADLMPEKPDVDPRKQRARARKLYQRTGNLSETARQIEGVGWRKVREWVEDLIPDVDPRIQQARELYQQGISRIRISKKLRVHHRALNKWLADLIPKKPDADPRKQQARELYQQGVSKQQIMKELQVGWLNLNKWLADLIPDVDLKKQQVIKSFMQGMGKRQIKRQFRVGEQLLNKWILGLIYVDPKKQQARKLYEQGFNRGQIAKKLHTNYYLLNKWLDLRRRNPDESIRNLERKATQGDIDARDQLIIEYERIQNWEGVFNWLPKINPLLHQTGSHELRCGCVANSGDAPLVTVAEIDVSQGYGLVGKCRQHGELYALLLDVNSIVEAFDAEKTFLLVFNLGAELAGYHILDPEGSTQYSCTGVTISPIHASDLEVLPEQPERAGWLQLRLWFSPEMVHSIHAFVTPINEHGTGHRCFAITAFTFADIGLL